MKQKYLKLFLPFVTLIGMLFLPACTNKWDEHYDEETFNLPDKTLKEVLREHPDLTIFSNMLNIAGYNDILDASQSYTIWAPVNSALSGVDTTNMVLVRDIVENHIARSRLSTANVMSRSVRMINGKYINFTREPSGFSFGNNMIIDPNLPAFNGLVHVIDGYTPYVNNLWEYISKTEGLDSLWSYLTDQNKFIFDPENSIEIGFDSTGAALYDSAFVFSNLFLKNIGAINKEDSIYTAILPDNTAWSEAYGRIESFFNFPANAGGAERQRDLTRFTLVKDILFKGQITQPGILDSLVSTTGNVFYYPGYLFNTQPVTISNGMAYITNQMPFADTLSWFKEIRVEAENVEGRNNSGSNIFLRTSYGSGLDVSKNRYIFVDPTSIDPSVEFSIPNTLSAKYNMYCVFVPASIVDPFNLTPTKAKFKLTYIRRATGSTFISNITPVNNYTNPLGMTKMLVNRFDFEYANVIDEEFDRVAVKLEVINDVTPAEEQAGTYSRTMRIDCIIFEPVSE